jgi:tRNA threonylcarbamoyladenosine biosynthesis protein TsaE
VPEACGFSVLESEVNTQPKFTMDRPAASVSEEDLRRWGTEIGRAAATPLVIVLRGDLGSGKTTLARAIARGTGVRGVIPSPTYNLLFRYSGEGGKEVIHIDLYRLDHADDVWELGWSELPGNRDLVLIEWGERAESFLPEPRWEIRLEEGGRSDLREVGVRPVGDPPGIALPVSGE